MTEATAGPASSQGARAALLRRGLRLEYLTVGWNLLEGVVAVTAALAAGSVALLGFGIDSFVESASGSVLIWRLLAERRAVDHEAIERLEHRAERLVALSLFLLAAYITVDAGLALWNRERPEASPAGIAITTLSIGVMWWLARAKRRTAVALGSRSLEADAAPDHRLLVAVAGRPGRDRAQRHRRLVVGRPRRRPRRGPVPGQGGPRGLARRPMLRLTVSPHVVPAARVS